MFATVDLIGVGGKMIFPYDSVKKSNTALLSFRGD